jgi:hypothetical protein
MLQRPKSIKKIWRIASNEFTMEGVEKWMRNECGWANAWCGSNRNITDARRSNQAASLIVRHEDREVWSSQQISRLRVGFTDPKQASAPSKVALSYFSMVSIVLHVA